MQRYEGTPSTLDEKKKSKNLNAIDELYSRRPIHKY